MQSALKLVAHPHKITDLILVRHGQTDWNAEHRMMGRRPIPLNETGRAQLVHAASLLPDLRPRALISSPMLRTLQSMEILKETLGLEQSVEQEEGIAEFGLGDWVGHSIHDLRARDDWQAYLRDPAGTTFPNGESVAEIQTRAVAAVNRWIQNVEGGSLVFVSHGGVVRLLLMAAYGMPLAHYHHTHVDNGAVSQIRLMPAGRPRVVCVNRSPDTLQTV